MKLLLATIFVCGLLSCAEQLCSARTWSDASGKFTVEAELVEVRADKVILKRADGSEAAVPWARLSPADREYLRSIGDGRGAPEGPAADPQVGELLNRVVQQSNVPAMAGAIVSSDGLVAFGVAGARKRGADSPAVPDDLWHLGSDTKAMTATLVAKLVEQGKLKWDMTLGEIFSDKGGSIHPDLQNVTLLQLLSHRAGLPANLALKDYWGADGRRERLKAARQELAKPPAQPVGEFAYSNLGYIIVGAIIEQETSKPWEKNMVEHVFRPLGMASVGFGGTGTPGKLDQPWGHTADGEPTALNGPKIDNPPVMSPAGRVHCTIQDWSKFVADLLSGMNDKPALLPSDAYQKLTTPPFGGDYALGWSVTQRDWAGGMALQHSGSNTMNYATAWIAPKRDFAILACTNQAGDAGQKACNAAVVALIEYRKAIAAK